MTLDFIETDAVEMCGAIHEPCSFYPRMYCIRFGKCYGSHLSVVIDLDGYAHFVEWYDIDHHHNSHSSDGQREDHLLRGLLGAR